MIRKRRKSTSMRNGPRRSETKTRRGGSQRKQPYFSLISHSNVTYGHIDEAHVTASCGVILTYFTDPSPCLRAFCVQLKDAFGKYGIIGEADISRQASCTEPYLACLVMSFSMPFYKDVFQSTLVLILC